jgi:hypothetical protein
MHIVGASAETPRALDALFRIFADASDTPRLSGVVRVVPTAVHTANTPLMSTPSAADAALATSAKASVGAAGMRASLLPHVTMTWPPAAGSGAYGRKNWEVMGSSSTVEPADEREREPSSAAGDRIAGTAN